MPRSITEGRYRARATSQHVGILPTEIPIPKHERNVVPDVGRASLFWYACTCVPQGERKAAESLRREAGTLRTRHASPLTVYVPCATEWVRRKRGPIDLPRREVQTPLTRSYVFVATDGPIRSAHLEVMSERDHERRNRHGLIAVLGNAGVPSPFGRSDVEFLERLSSAERRCAEVHRIDRSAFEAGDSVDVLSGAFATFGGIVTGVDPEQGRLTVEMDIFGRATPIELDYADVQKAA